MVERMNMQDPGRLFNPGDMFGTIEARVVEVCVIRRIEVAYGKMCRAHCAVEHNQQSAGVDGFAPRECSKKPQKRPRPQRPPLQRPEPEKGPTRPPEPEEAPPTGPPEKAPEKEGPPQRAPEPERGPAEAPEPEEEPTPPESRARPAMYVSGAARLAPTGAG
jgi:hypothetical protein